MRLAYVHLTRFPIQRKVIDSPSLAGKPFALVAQERGQWRVAFASTSALQAGVRTQMTLSAAQAVLPELTHSTYVPAAEAEALASLGEALLAVAPGFQLSAPDGLWLDASAAPLWGGEEGLCARAIALCADHGYRARVVVAGQPFTARALARHGGPRAQVVAARESAAALAPLPLAALEREGGEVVAAFGELGLTCLGEVAALPLGAVVARQGASGLRAHRLCRGEDDTPFRPALLSEVLEERIALDWPAESYQPLLFALKTAFDRLCARLAGRGRAALKVTLTFQLDPSGQAQLPLVLARPSAQSKLLVELAKHRIADLTLQSPVGGLCVRVDEACEGPASQLALGDAPSGDASLDVILSRLSTTLGEEALFAAELEAFHRPEAAYAARAFRPPEPQTGLLADLPGAGGAASGAEEVFKERPCRLFSQAAQLEAEIGGAGELVSARILGKRRRATAVAGPERLCGEWWADAPYSRDYYRVVFDGLGAVWVFRDGRDGRFYLQGMFD